MSRDVVIRITLGTREVIPVPWIKQKSPPVEMQNPRNPRVFRYGVLLLIGQYSPLATEASLYIFLNAVTDVQVMSILEW
jgi:hypothetical protein